MAKKKIIFGSVNIAPRAIATIAYQATIESYGVVGLASKGLVNGITNFIVKDATHGIDVNYKNELVNIDLYVIIEYGTNIKSVSANVAKTVRFNVEKSLGLPINEVNVHVQGLRISNEG